MTMKRIILASGSPRRRDILRKAGLDFEIHPSSYEEKLSSNQFSYGKIENLAFNKAVSVADELDYNAIIIGADTVVVLNNTILTKPKDEKDAYKMLCSLSGVPHQVVTGICVIDKYKNTIKVKSVTTTVEFEHLTDKQINDYIKIYRPLDKAGAYGIQELPDGFVKRVDGSLENVIGLCSKTTIEMIKE